MTDDKNGSLMEMFVFETNQMLEQLEAALLGSEDSGNISSENINEIFRIMHTIKGSAAMMSQNHISTAAHTLEDLFFYIREEKPDINLSQVCDITFLTIDYIRSKIGELTGETETDHVNKWKDDDEFLEKLTGCVAEIKQDKKSKPVSKNTPKSELKVNKTEDEDIEKKFRYKAVVFFYDDCSMCNVRAFMVAKRMRDHCVEVATEPCDLESSCSSEQLLKNGLVIYFNSDINEAEIKNLIEDTTDVKSAVVEKINGFEEKAEAGSDSSKSNESSSAEQAENSKVSNEKIKSTKQNLINVDLNKLDKLINIVGEIVIAESMVAKSPDLANLKLENFKKASRQLQKLTEEMQDIVLSVRMLPVKVIFEKMYRIVRDMSKALGKEAILEISGEETEVDKNVIDSLGDPLMHLIRNCMDHGIESKEERIKKGKPPVGKIRLDARYNGGDVIITVSDDGAGLDKQKILSKAKKAGLISEGDNPTEKEIFNFILLPGFSTNDKVTEFSGRGVGMDVVKKNVDSLRGSINVNSESGHGTVFYMKIPMSLAIINGMMIKVGTNIYILPTQSILQFFRPQKGSVFSDVEGRDMIFIRDDCVPVIKLHNIFGTDTCPGDYSEGVLILTECGEKKICLFADNIIEEQAVVVKPLPSYLNDFNNPGLGGCTILGDGSVRLILDVEKIANSYLT